ncbi:Abhydrolase domain-containing protein-2 [Dirofilaria immitis]|nr:Abhydrolase domain-containing protein-2 [Dirofilaria immitis]
MSKAYIMEIVERSNPTMIITKEEAARHGNRYMEGYFLSPLSFIFPDLLPDNIGQATWRGKFSKIKHALVIHLAGTGDHSYFRREFGFANDLMKSNISSILLQNPFYGSRKPRDQFRSSLINVSDLFIMGGALIAECNFLLKWARKQGYWPVGLAGVSMGGHMACLACTNFPEPIAVVPCLSWTTASTVFVQGTLSKSISWDVLTMELLSKKFQDRIRQIPECDWLDKAYEMEKNWMKIHHLMPRNFMYVLMEEFTNLSNYPTPKDTRLVKNIIAENDGYVIRAGVPTMQQVWPGTTVEVIKGKGHIEAYLASHTLFRNCIREMLRKNQELYSP